MYKSYPTKYKHVQFRSRLEARWAAFFDLLEMSWEYEPIDLSGYIPDFILPNFYSPLLIEVKPVLRFEDFSQHISKIDASGWEGPVMIVGAKLFIDSYPHSIVGLVRHESRWSACRLLRCRWLCYDWMFTSDIDDNGNFFCLGTKGCGGGPSVENGIYGENFWERAGNIVQWKRP